MPLRSIHVVTNSRISLFIAEWYTVVYTYHIYPFICWQTFRLFPLSCLLQIMLQWTWECKYLFKILISFSSETYSRTKSLYIFTLPLHFVFLIFCLYHVPFPVSLSSTESEVTPSCLTLCDPMDCSPPGSSVHGILQARILEWVAIFFSRGSSPPRDRTQVSRIAGRHFNLWATREAHKVLKHVLKIWLLRLTLFYSSWFWTL